MRGNWMIRTLACGIGLAMGATGVSASVTGATVADADNGDYTLTSVTVSRGSAGSFTYLPSQLTGVDLTDVAAYSVPFISQYNASLPAPGTRATLIEDNRLDTGVTNPVKTTSPFDQAFEVTFLEPVVNSTGDDIVIFKLASTFTTRFYIDNDPAKHVDIGSANISGALINSMPYTRFVYNNNGDTTVNDLAELESATGFTASNKSSNVDAIGIDLSLFGIAEGETLTSIRFQAGNDMIDPVLIAGLPAVPEPGSFTLIGGIAAGMLLRRRSRGVA